MLNPEQMKKLAEMRQAEAVKKVHNPECWRKGGQRVLEGQIQWQWEKGKLKEGWRKKFPAVLVDGRMCWSKDQCREMADYAGEETWQRVKARIYEGRESVWEVALSEELPVVYVGWVWSRERRKAWTENRAARKAVMEAEVNEEAEKVGALEGFERVQKRLLRELMRRTRLERSVKGLDNDELGKLLKTCRENITALRELAGGTGSESQEMKVVMNIPKIGGGVQ